MRPAEPLVLATRNLHKLEEVRRILKPLGIEVQALPEGIVLPPEDGETFAENALGKARASAVSIRTPVIADDSGIEAEALDGAPGVRSARYAGPHADDAQNLSKLIMDVAPGSALRYVCVLAYIEPAGGEERIFVGECTGRMASHTRGRRGFGYDPVFEPAELGDQRTMAELTEAEKDAISHRGRALREFTRWLNEG